MGSTTTKAPTTKAPTTTEAPTTTKAPTTIKTTEEPSSASENIYEGPCVSECWESLNGKCTLKSECASIDCEATKMIIRFNEKLFGKTTAKTSSGLEGKIDLSDKGVQNNPFFIDCVYGESNKCGTIHKFENEKLYFKTLLGDFNNEEEKIIRFDENFILRLAAQQMSISFRCEYALNVEVTSQKYRPKEMNFDANLEGENLGLIQNTGFLNEGFKLVINEGDTNPILIGEPLSVEATWILNLPDIEFYFLDCHVTHQGMSIFVIEQSCYANALGSTPEKISKFSFRTF